MESLLNAIDAVSGVFKRRCSYCDTAQTHQWHRGPTSHPLLCNACGIRWRRKGTLESAYIPLAGRQCSHCDTTRTPRWHRGPATHPLLCNACGLYWKRYGYFNPEPAPIIRTSTKKCSNCQTTETPTWHSGPASHPVLCNACGVYWKRHGEFRIPRVKEDSVRSLRRGGFISVAQRPPYTPSAV
jgi:NMD protein affecting ribosome stability and mRNA decay